MEVTGIWWRFFAQVCAEPHPLGTTSLLFLLHFKNSSIGGGDEQQKANPKHLKISGSLENHEAGFGVSLYCLKETCAISRLFLVGITKKLLYSKKLKRHLN